MTVTLGGLLMADVITWDGGGSDNDLFNEANWDQGGSDPVAGTIDANTQLNHDLVINTDVTIDGSLGNLQLGETLPGSITMTAGVLNMLGSDDNRAIRTTGSGTPVSMGTILLSGTASVSAQYISGVSVYLGGSSFLTINGGGDGISTGAIVDLTSTTSVLYFNDETPSATLSEHLGEITVNGAAAVVGLDAAVYEAGDNLIVTTYNGALGSQVQAIPEPASASLILFCGGCMLLLRRLKM
jgi:hypothetical protein